MSKVTFASDHPDVWAMYSTFSGWIAFDIGANGGMVSELLAPNFKRVVAFEPCKESADELRKAQIPNITINEVAVSDVNGKILLEEMSTSTARMGELVTASAETNLAMYWGEKLGVREVPAVRLDTCVDLYGYPDFIKIDVEGHEQKVIEGGVDFLTRQHPKLVIEIHRADYGRAIREMLPDYEWSVFYHPTYEKRNMTLKTEHYWMVSK